MSLIVFKKVKKYCKRYDIALKYLIDVISDPKVIPMIRGKSFEYTVSDFLKNMLSSKWKVENLNINAQPGVHDIDVLVTRIVDKKQIRVECKLTKNNSFAINGNVAELRVKCMRSRTFSDNPAATRMAQNYGINRNLLLIHADSYREQDFAFVITSLGNSLWTTINGKYIFNGNKQQHDFLKQIFPEHFKDFSKFQQEAFTFLMFARSSELIVGPQNNLTCTRRKCRLAGSQADCGFIPNYPIVQLNNVAKNIGSWKKMSNLEVEFNNFLG